MRHATSTFTAITADIDIVRHPLAASNDQLDLLLSQTDATIQQLSATWNGLMHQLQRVERAIAETNLQARRLDAFVDDALYSGDAATARRCADESSRLRRELERLNSQFRSNKELAGSLQQNMDALRSGLLNDQ